MRKIVSNSLSHLFSLSVFDSSQIVSLIVKYGIENFLKKLKAKSSPTSQEDRVRSSSPSPSLASLSLTEFSKLPITAILKEA